MIRELIARHLKLPDTLRIVMPEKIDRTRGPRMTEEDLLSLATSNHVTDPSPNARMLVHLGPRDETVPPRAVEILRRNDGAIYIKQEDSL